MKYTKEGWVCQCGKSYFSANPIQGLVACVYNIYEYACISCGRRWITAYDNGDNKAAALGSQALTDMMRDLQHKYTQSVEKARKAKALRMKEMAEATNIKDYPKIAKEENKNLNGVYDIYTERKKYPCGHDACRSGSSVATMSGCDWYGCKYECKCGY